ncbi:glycosyltransferase family 61 protein [Reyranella sp.]|uniref:glycosyltransferase family 61 protein n=1 Tax=Reyranella sp. TaxID=1929291 RepID=UPI003D0C0AE9
MSEDVSKAPDPLSLSESVADNTGVFEIRKGLFLEVLEKQTYLVHNHFRASLPESNGIEAGFDAGPVYVVYANDSHVDIRAGLTVIDGRPVRETAVVPKLFASYQGASAEELAAALDIDDGRIVLPLASQRMGNYCRWWLDSMGKLFVCSKSSLLRENLRGSSLDVVVPDLPISYQQQSVDMLSWRPLVSANHRDRLLRGRTVNSSGLTFGGGQRIGTQVREMARFLDLLLPAPVRHSRDRSGELLYVTRNESSMRRILNEDELLPGLKDMGFRIVSPAMLSLPEQIDAFRNARIVLSAHGAQLTNILFCRPNTTLVEIFPEGGVHGSAFLRIASQLGFNYYYVVGEKVENKQSRKNPNNADLTVDKSAFLRFTKEIVDAELNNRHDL